jgi:ADP-heptose:LPS heptosyltransferase
MLLFVGIAPGDDILCTAVLRELKQRKRGSVWYASNFPEIFHGLDYVDRNLPAGKDFDAFLANARRLTRFAKLWRIDIRHLTYAAFDHTRDWSEIPKRHIIAELCARSGVTGPVSLRPDMKLTPQECAEAEWVKGCLVIQSSGLGARSPMRNKQWFPERFQAVVDQLRNHFEFVQVGSEGDPLLEHVIDLRGKTTIRQSAAILHNAALYIGNVGFLMHVARAVECPSVIVYGGREAPWQSGYSCNINLYTALHCAPCWQRNTCNFDQQCMKDISADHVVQGVKQLLARPRGPLFVDTYDITL